MNEIKTERSFGSLATCLIEVLGFYFFDMLSVGACTTGHWQTIPEVNQISSGFRVSISLQCDLNCCGSDVNSHTYTQPMSLSLQVLHTLCDGSPAHMEFKVAEALEDFNRDPDSKIRRQAHKVLSNYTRTGKWNIM